MDQNSSKPTILAVDDSPANIDVVKGLLSRDYIVQAAVNGKIALKIMEKKKPDLILLDIMMPDMDGYEVCRRIKQNEQTRDTPIIFVTARTEIDSMVKGFEIGGMDYVTKPFNPEELLARVKTHLELKRAREEIKAQNIKLEKQNQELIIAARLREDVERIMRHDLKTPLNAIIGFSELSLSEQKIDEKTIGYIKIIKDSGYRMLSMINRSLDIFKMEQGIYQFDPVPVNIIHVIGKIIQETRNLANKRNLTLDILLNGHPAGEKEECFVSGEELLCYSMLANLIQNALEASPKGERVTVSLREKEEVTIKIHNKRSVPKDIRDRFFEKYVTFGKGEFGTGLGTYSAKLIAETQQSGIAMTTSEDDGTTVTIRMPK